MSATESGWDFSSRWFKDPMDIKTIHITNMIPVDLNSIMFRNEAILHEFHKTLCTRRARFYEQAIRKRQRVMNTLMWDKTLFAWGDYDIANKKINTEYLYISDLTPLWAGIEPPVEPSLILARYKSILMDHVSGIPASNVKSGQQWVRKPLFLYLFKRKSINKINIQGFSECLGAISPLDGRILPPHSTQRHRT